MTRIGAPIALAAALLTTPALAEEGLRNPSFENGWSGWIDVDPGKDATAISGHAHTGAKSAKITKGTGRFEQAVALYPDSDYVLTAVVKGPGVIGVELDGAAITAMSETDSDVWVPLEIAFSTGSSVSGTIYGAHNGGEGRFDDFVLTPVSGPALEAANAEPEGPRDYATIPGACDRMSQLRIRSAADDGTHDGHGPEMAIDGDFDPASRWSSKMPGKELVLDMGMPQTLKEIGLAFYKGNERATYFAVATSQDGSDYLPLIERAESAGTTTAIERFDFDDRVVRFIKVIGQGNSSNEWNSIVEVQAYGCGFGEIASQGDGSDTAKVAGLSAYGLATDKPPAENFDLTNWKITLPVDADGDGRADEVSETLMAEGWTDSAFFYTDPATGGMVFRVSGGGATTQNSSYPRVELREMLRGGDESIPTRAGNGTPTKNNWVFSAAPGSAKALAGAVDGTMTARLAINQVTRLGDSSKLGRVIIGQIHAKDGEPIRLYYRKLPMNKFGSIYYIHERAGMDDIYVPIIGGREDGLANPEDGIALDEVFDYAISVSGKTVNGEVHPILNVSITRDDGTVIIAPPLDMVGSGYHVHDEFMYFKAGAYTQNNTSTWPERDFDQVTFYALAVRH